MARIPTLAAKIIRLRASLLLLQYQSASNFDPLACRSALGLPVLAE